MKIRKAIAKDLEKISEVEAVCFPKSEAASKETINKRLSVFANHFYLLFDDDTLVGFVNGMVSDKDILCDEMYENAQMHNENGKWQMIFGVDVIPKYRRMGCAERILKEVIKESKEQGRDGIVLTCKEKLIHYYSKFGFENLGISKSTHGGAVWYDMRLTF